MSGALIYSTDLEAVAEAVLVRGPTRVLVSQSGDALPPRRAKIDHGISWDIVFIRDDGWSLGAPSALEAIAYSIWPDKWIGFVRRGDNRVRSICEYQPTEEGFGA
jgi:hypothetical protein